MASAAPLPRRQLDPITIAERYPSNSGAPKTPQYAPPPLPLPQTTSNFNSAPATATTTTSESTTSPTSPIFTNQQIPASAPVSPPTAHKPGHYSGRSMLDIGDEIPRTNHVERNRNGSSASSNAPPLQRLTHVTTMPTMPFDQLTHQQQSLTHNRERSLGRIHTSPNLIQTLNTAVAKSGPLPAANDRSIPHNSMQQQDNEALVKPVTNTSQRNHNGPLPPSAFIPLPDRTSAYRTNDQSRQTRPQLRQQATTANVVTTPKESGLLKKVNSFLHKKNRSNSPPQVRAPSGPPPLQVRHSRDGSMSSSQVPSPSATPPSPRSRQNTMPLYEEDVAPDQSVSAQPTSAHRSPNAGLGHSTSSSEIVNQARAESPRVGIRWAETFGEKSQASSEEGQHHHGLRRRSISQDNLKEQAKQRTEERRGKDELRGRLQATFSQNASEGVGLKARRLSTAIPDEFFVESSDLSKEYVAAGHGAFSVRGKTVGKGATAIVRLMVKRSNKHGPVYAVKEYRTKEKGEAQEEYLAKLKSEYAISHSLKHPNIVQSLQLCTNGERWNNIMEYCKFGELYHWVEKGVVSHQWTVTDRNCLFKQLLRGVAYLHEHGIAHRDIKLENLLLTEQGYLKITDFGVSDVFSGQHPGSFAARGKCGQNMNTVRRCGVGVCGSMPYIAPEVLAKNGDYDPRGLDVWSCAIAYITMTYGGGPWDRATMEDPKYRAFKEGWDKWTAKHPDQDVSDESIPTLPGMFDHKARFGLTQTSSPAMKRILLRMLHPNPDRRISMDTLINSSYIRGLECCAPEACDDDHTHDAAIDCTSKNFKKAQVLKKHKHIPPKEHKTPEIFRHRFDMGHGYA